IDLTSACTLPASAVSATTASASPRIFIQSSSSMRLNKLAEDGRCAYVKIATISDTWKVPIASAIDDVAQVNRHHEKFGNWTTVGPHGEGPSPRGQLDSTGFDIIRGQLRRCETTCDIHVVVVPPQQQIGSEIEPLYRGVG